MDRPKRFGRRSMGWVAAVVVLGACMTYAWAVSPTIEPGLQDAKTGKVLDAATRLPIAGAYVVVRWQKRVSNPFLVGHGGGYPDGGGCVHREVVRTDENGVFHVPSTHTAIRPDFNLRPNRGISYHWDLSVYAPGYGPPLKEMSDGTGLGPFFYPSYELAGRDLLKGEQKLAPMMLAQDSRVFRGRAATLSKLASDVDCSPSSSDPLPFIPSLFREALAATCQTDFGNGALALLSIRERLSPPLSSDVRAKIIAIKDRQHGYQAPTASVEDERRLCTLLAHTGSGPRTQHEQEYAASCATPEPREGLKEAYSRRLPTASKPLPAEIEKQIADIESRYRPYAQEMVAPMDERELCMLLAEPKEARE